MAKNSTLSYEFVIPQGMWNDLQSHLFPGDQDEHGAVIAAGVAVTDGRVRLLARNLFKATDGVDYVPGNRGYRMLTANFVRDCALFCRDEKLAYLAVHNHGGNNTVEFSADDLQSHERGYPALKDITRGQIVGGLVFAQNAVAGDLWLEDGRAQLNRATIFGRNMNVIFPAPPPRPPKTSFSYDRQARIFGDRGQTLLKQLRVGIIGLGGVGSLVCEHLARLGVGTLILIDADRVEASNIPRIVGSSDHSTRRGPAFLERLLGDSDIGRFKVDVAEREAKRANRHIRIVKYKSNVVENSVAMALCDCDFIFLAADSMQARLVFNALVHQYLIPGIQLGVKVPVTRATGEVGRIFCAIRPVLPGHGCLWCNGLITADGLQREALTEEERRQQQYVEEENIPSPSVITLNALAASHGVNDFLFRMTGLRELGAVDDYTYIEPRTGSIRHDIPRADGHCTECGSLDRSRFARGDEFSLPTRQR